MEEYLIKKIYDLEKEIERLENQEISKYKSGIVTVGVKDSDLGVKVPFETSGLVLKTDEELLSEQKSKDNELYRLKSELALAREELFSVDWDKTENVVQRDKEKAVMSKEEIEKELSEKRFSHESSYKDLNRLVQYLEIVGLRDLARRLSNFRFAFHKKDSPFISREIDLQSEEKTFKTSIITTKKEYNQIKKNVVRLSKDMTKAAKKYKELYTLFLNAHNIVRDIEKKGITQLYGSELKNALDIYFNEPTGEYYSLIHGSDYELKSSSNLGYQYLDFYRDPNSKYNEDVRKHRL